MNRPDTADRLFKDGFNCAQSVLFAYSETLNLPADTALKIANGFGGGMGRTQEVCGAVSGAIMVIGLLYGRGRNDGKEKQEKTYQKVREFVELFKKKYGTVNCRELLSGCCLLTEEGQTAFKGNGLIERCYEYVRVSCAILDEIQAGADS